MPTRVENTRNQLPWTPCSSGFKMNPGLNPPQNRLLFNQFYSGLVLFHQLPPNILLNRAAG